MGNLFCFFYHLSKVIFSTTQLRKSETLGKGVNSKQEFFHCSIFMPFHVAHIHRAFCRNMLLHFSEPERIWRANALQRAASFPLLELGNKTLDISWQADLALHTSTFGGHRHPAAQSSSRPLCFVRIRAPSNPQQQCWCWWGHGGVISAGSTPETLKTFTRFSSLLAHTPGITVHELAHSHLVSKSPVSIRLALPHLQLPQSWPTVPPTCTLHRAASPVRSPAESREPGTNPGMTASIASTPQLQATSREPGPVSSVGILSAHHTPPAHPCSGRSIVFTQRTPVAGCLLRQFSAEVCIRFLSDSCSFRYQKHVIIHQMEPNKNTTSAGVY